MVAGDCISLSIRVEHHFEGFEEFCPIDHAIGVVIDGFYGFHGLCFCDGGVDVEVAE